VTHTARLARDNGQRVTYHQTITRYPRLARKPQAAVEFAILPRQPCSPPNRIRRRHGSVLPAGNLPRTDALRRRCVASAVHRHDEQACPLRRELAHLLQQTSTPRPRCRPSPRHLVFGGMLAAKEPTACRECCCSPPSFSGQLRALLARQAH